jgi:menaquinone-dependent protoporphyrinogen oxidase
VLAAKGLEVTVIPPEKVGPVEEFDAVVLGNAVYMGQWMKPARELAERQAAALATRPVWLFSSGPVGEPAKPRRQPVDVTTILQATKARDHQIFTGKLAKSTSASPTGPGLGHPHPRGRLPQLGRDQGMGDRHRRHSAC